MMTTKAGNRFSPPPSVSLVLALGVLLLLCLSRAVAGGAVGREEAARDDEERRQLDLDNSIGALADVAPGKQQAAVGESEQRTSERRPLGEEDKERTRNEDNNTPSGRRQPDSNDLAPSGESRPPAASSRHFYREELEQKLEAATKPLSRRLDLLELELRKTLLLLHHQMRIKPAAADASGQSAAAEVGNDFEPANRQTSQQPPTEDGADSSQRRPKSDQAHHKPDSSTTIGKSHLEAVADLSSRLELMEKFITVTTKKLYETEQRVKQLERCDCRLKCKWMQPTTAGETLGALADSPQSAKQASFVVKMDGQVWQHKCDVCSCHRGHVRCRHVSCPKADCPEPSYAPGRCCPVCHKSCVFNGQTVKHGHKLVINSKQNTCKECLCSDGRLECHRVELLAASGSNNATSAPGAEDRDDHRQAETNRVQRVQRSTRILVDLGLDFALAAGAADELRVVDEPTPRRQVRSLELVGGQLVCPQIDACPRAADQVRLKSDCCTYCRGFDFCSLYGRAHCHPDAVCANTNNSSSSSASTGGQSAEMEPRAPSLSAMFECRCRAGFAGDGRLCRDIDECADPKLNACRAPASYCVNLPGGHQCKCRPGFQEISDGDSGARGKVGPTTSCRDIDECADGKLNRCHPQASCVNLSGSYKCHCKRGYLGNGFECHQWFSARPNAAAYLHRHSATAAASANGSSNLANKSSAISVPLDSLLDADDDRSDVARDELDALEYRYDDADHAEDDERHQSRAPATSKDELADLADSRWEPLRFVSEQAGAFQQTGDGLVGANQQQQQVSRHQTTDDSDPNGAISGRQPAPTTRSTPEPEPEPQMAPSMSSLNTRTMFFQPPPRFRRPQATAAANLNASLSSSSADSAGATASGSPAPSGSANKSDMTTRSQAFAGSSSIHEPSKQSEPSSSSAATSEAPARTAASSAAAASQKQQQRAAQQPRPGSIIASATTSPIRGFGHHPNHYASQQFQHRSLFQHQQQHKALTRASSSSSSSSSTTGFSIPTISLAKVARFITENHSFNNLKIRSLLVASSSLSLVFTLVSTMLQIFLARPHEPLYDISI